MKKVNIPLHLLCQTARLYKKCQEKLGDNIVYGLQLGTSYYLGFNLDRQKYDHTAKTTDEQKASTKKAILNKDFRQAVNFGFDRKSYAAQVSGSDAAENTLRSTFGATNICPSQWRRFW